MAAEDNEEDEDESSSKKRKRVVLFGYSGSGFAGLQSQQGGIVHTRSSDVVVVDPSEANDNDTTPDTVEDALHLALCRAGAISESNRESLQKISWSRSARTDRGVHAASQVIAAKLELPGLEVPERGNDVSKRDEDRFVQQVNAHLPPSIRVYRCFRVNNNFNARYATSARTYGYFLPEFAILAEGTSPEIAQKKLFELRQALQCFVGSHTFHNFTDKLQAKDPRARRVIESFTCSEPFVLLGKKVFRVQVRGQSFLKHHIRRMIGFAVECLRRGEQDIRELIQMALAQDKLCRADMPMAPAESLFLDVASFDWHNPTTAAQQREPIDFVQDPVVRQAREKLIQEVILPAVFCKEGGAFEAFEKWIAQRDLVEFPPAFVTPNIPPQLQDAQEFLRCVERNRSKRQKVEEYSR